jgi:hypothetical protein
VIVEEACHPKCRRGMVRRHGEQQLVDFAGKVRVMTRRCNQTALGIDADGNDNAAASLRATTDVANDFPARQAVIVGKILLQPFRKRVPCASSRDFDSGTPVGIAQTHKSEVEVQ